MTLRNFTLSEFDSKDKDGSGAGTGARMQPSTLAMLDNARDIAGVPFTINSGFRTVAHNKAVGGVANSSHLGGWAADIKTTPATQTKVLAAVRKAGFKRIGIYKTFIHVDNDPTKPSPAEWIK